MTNHFKILLFILSFSLCVNAKENDSISKTNILVPNHSLNIHVGTIPFPLGGKVGIGYRFKRTYFEADYFGYNSFYGILSIFPYAGQVNANSKASFTTNYFFKNKRKASKHYAIGITLLKEWDNNSLPNKNDGELGFHVYPSVGYFNDSINEGPFGVGIKLGVLSYIHETQNPNSDWIILPMLDLTLSLRLFQTK